MATGNVYISRKKNPVLSELHLSNSPLPLYWARSKVGILQVAILDEYTSRGIIILYFNDMSQ